MAWAITAQLRDVFRLEGRQMREARSLSFNFTVKMNGKEKQYVTNPAPLHAGISQFSGIIHFANGCAYIELNPANKWPLLIFDPQLTGQVSLAALSQTATAFQGKHQDGDPITVSGVILIQPINGQPLPVLHIVLGS
jgi:hypothetical protein